MVIKYIKNKIYKLSASESISNIIDEIKSIRKNHNSIILYGSPTEINWLGIKNATIGLYPENSLELPQQFSESKISNKNQIKICNELINQNFDKILISGFANYFFKWIETLHHHTKIEVLFHGTISEFHSKEKQKFISMLIEFGNSNKISKFGFVKEGINEVFKNLYDLDSYHQPLITPKIPNKIKKFNLDPSKTHIGVFGIDNFNKNLHNQVIYSLMNKNTIVHVLDKNRFKYLKMENRIVGYNNNLNRNDFLSLLASMDLNLYMSYSESWGLIKYESEKMGVPCLELNKIDYFKTIKSAINNLKK